jgi:hypothetical protein
VRKQQSPLCLGLKRHDGDAARCRIGVNDHTGNRQGAADPDPAALKAR